MRNLKSYHYFWIVSSIILLIGLSNLKNEDSTIDVNIHDTYYVIEHFLLAEILFFGYLFLGLGYWLVEKILKKQLISILTRIHTSILIGSFLVYWIVILYTKILSKEDDIFNNSYEKINITLMTMFLAIIFIAQPIYITNILIALFRKKLTIG
ncbi:cbb3-type cytochrome c oxidase subunit I [Flavobacterium nitrogenifigens]|uniref:Cytochrome C and Quinol oxidase polypeptide I n=1 Tax=Flavobacterium nitrogenifigens TaxID=1617283 RepID=A0A521F8H7_9FLAO|nr:cbb3-type cytochrome c oxidase subunit I [Flavobacterium nitrogenifigens]KAF2337832.1 cbb3-type cytochrome c oxidase subunit I [Flavobacterium nitrogenifigens]SMO92436.1 Cytochrome C and Quinol oxidase polypeptide I [Flavobacterium nitrogenifigens]